MRRISITGTSCSGKTTLAGAVAARLGLPHVEMDALFWGPAWRPAPDPVFRARVATAVGGDGWVLDGGYSALADLVWPRIDTVVWLDFPMPIVLARWARRTIRRIRSGEEFWPGTGNRESVSNALRRGGLLWWILRTHRRRRRRMLDRIAAHPHVTVVRLRSPAAANRWLASLPHATDPVVSRREVLGS